MTRWFDNSVPLGALKLKYAVSNVEPKYALFNTLAAPLLRISAALEIACGMMGMDEAPVPPNTEPRINTFGCPF